VNVKHTAASPIIPHNSNTLLWCFWLVFFGPYEVEISLSWFD